MVMRGRGRIGIGGNVDIEGLVMIYESHVYFNAVLEYDEDDNYEYVLVHDLECYAFSKI